MIYLIDLINLLYHITFKLINGCNLKGRVKTKHYALVMAGPLANWNIQVMAAVTIVIMTLTN